MHTYLPQCMWACNTLSFNGYSRLPVCWSSSESTLFIVLRFICKECEIRDDTVHRLGWMFRPAISFQFRSTLAAWNTRWRNIVSHSAEHNLFSHVNVGVEHSPQKQNKKKNFHTKFVQSRSQEFRFSSFVRSLTVWGYKFCEKFIVRI